ncbi:MAG TPA: 5-deoxy-glucuronate isomerase [Terriglobales bacterium]|nr:5-deoxy-glucuronate isomerase [Terriglobales bacterium]
MSIAAPLVAEKMIFRHTDAQVGRHISVTPKNSTNRHLSYGRIRLNKEVRSVAFANSLEETGFLVLSGAAQVKAAGETIKMGQYDAIYIPRGSQISVETTSEVDIAEFSAPVDNAYPLQYVNYAEMSKDPGLKFDAGVGTGAARHLHMSCAKNVQAGRIVFGWTYSDPGNWTSWPPHEHASMLEEMYVYFNMPAPAFGLQLVYHDTEYPELVVPVREGDAVLMPSGYHPNVSVPGHKICFIWAMAAHKEVEDRKFGVVNVQPGFDQGGSGLEKGRAK